MTAGESSDMSDICDSNMRVLRSCLVLKEDSRQWSFSSSFSGAPTSASSREVKWADRLCFNQNNLFSASCVSRHSLSWNVPEKDTELPSPSLTSDLSKAERRGISLRRPIKFHVHRGVKSSNWAGSYFLHLCSSINVENCKKLNIQSSRVK